MSGLGCPYCQRKLELELQENGYCHCSCGELVPIPRVIQPSQTSGVQVSKAIRIDEDLVHVCECGKKLRISGKAQGQKFCCPCGKSFIAGSSSDASQPLMPTIAKPVINRASPIPPPVTVNPPASLPVVAQQLNPVPPEPQCLESNGLYDFLSDPVSMDSYTAGSLSHETSESTSSSNESTNPYSLSSEYLANARREASEKKRREREQESNEFGINNGVWGGIAMMVGAIVWFVVGYYAGRIYFYPPFLFFFGLVSLIKGLMG